MNKYPLASEIMRSRRPYLYSDSSSTDAYSLSRSEFSHFLDSLTQRNEHKDFEIFCRHLCERILCPNLRTQTGPEGGGDGKVDTETYAVSSEISDRWFSGEANAGQERWGFAISAKKTWSSKVSSDVKGIVGTGRKYDRIYFLTNQAVKAKTCHDKEMELTKKFDVPVTILDREWIIEKTFQNKCEYLAFSDLGAGRHDPAKAVIGPNDYKRQKQLDALEERLAKPNGELSDNTQAISDAFEAARMSRELERPRIETEWRYLRAIQLAETHGTTNQVLRAKYEYAWTMLWWHDDIEVINRAYEEIEKIAFDTDEAFNISKVCNLMQVLAARVAQEWETASHLQTTERHKRLMLKLDELSNEKSRPNNALYSETLLVLLGLSDTKHIGSPDALDIVWTRLSEIIDRAEGLGEYPADMIDEVVDGISSMLPESKPLDELLEKLAVFMGESQREGKAGALYLKRGNQKLEIEQPMEAVYWLGKASICFMKEEYREEQFKSLYGLAIAYRGAGLLWASRAVCLAALVQINAISAIEGDVRVQTLPTISLFAMICLQLGRVPDFLLTLYWYLSSYHSLPLAAESKELVEEKVTEFDRLFSCFLAGIEQKSLSHLLIMPDILDTLGLYMSNTVLMYRIGRGSELKRDGIIPPEVNDSEIREIVNSAASQPACRSLPNQARCNQNEDFDVSSKILGVNIRIVGGATDNDLLLCEVHLTALESFIATAYANGIWPKTEKITIRIQQETSASEPKIDFDARSMLISVAWPSEWDVQDSKISQQIGHYIVEFCIRVLSGIAMVPDAETTLENMFKDERLIERTVSFSLAHFAHGRVFGRSVSRLDDLGHLTKKTYKMVEPLPEVEPFELPKESHNDGDGKVFAPRSHDEVQVNSVINTHLWDKAGWKGLLFAHQGPESPYPPAIGLLFASREMAEAIFEGWIEIVGKIDEGSLIRLALLRGIDKDNKHHYRANISKSLDSISDTSTPSNTFLNMSRLHTMIPQSSVGLDSFLEQYSRFKAFYLMPAVTGKGGQPELLDELSILKRGLFVRNAWEIGRHDEDAVAISNPEQVLIPEGVEKPPCLEILERRSGKSHHTK